MAINLHNNKENHTLGFSPRISFSHDLCQTDLVTIERSRSDSLLLESKDFAFCISQQSFEQHPSSADELFSNGKILPLEVKKQLVLVPSKPPSHPTSAEKTKKENLKEAMEKTTKTEDKPPSFKSFWRFKRSSSCGNGQKRSSICSLPLLLRSNSTGSTPTPKRCVSSTTKSTTSSSSPFYPYPTSSKKNYGSYNSGGRIGHVLNVPPPYISKGTVNFFGLGSLFCNGKEKNKKKRSEFL